MKESNYNGFALIGVLITVFIIIALFYSVNFYLGKNKAGQNNLPAIKQEMKDLEKKVNERNRVQMEILNDSENKATTTK